MTVLFTAARHPRPWANGLGTTSEVIIWPPGSTLVTCDWRVSIADMVTDSAFSVLPGIDRTLVALAGGGLHLLVNGQPSTLEPFEVARFSGDSIVSGGPRGTATHDLNLMVRRPHTATLHVFTAPQTHTLRPKPGHTLLAIVADGTAEFSIGGGHGQLALTDAVHLHDTQAASIHSSSALILIEIYNCCRPSVE